MKKVSLVNEEYAAQLLKDATNELAVLNEKIKKSRLTNKDKLMREYLRTFVANPSPVNMILLMSGRLEDMKRINEVNS
jgi:phage host-nuclease inhibitor protein Gam